MIDVNKNCPSCGGNEFRNAYLSVSGGGIHVVSHTKIEKGFFKGANQKETVGKVQFKTCINCGEVISIKIIPNEKGSLNKLTDE